MDKFQIQIASAPDRENLVAEIWVENELLAEINQEKGYLEIELYPCKKVVCSYQDFLQVLNDAKKALES